jgi:hypothetical protein
MNANRAAHQKHTTRFNSGGGGDWMDFDEILYRRYATCVYPKILLFQVSAISNTVHEPGKKLDLTRFDPMTAFM